MRTKTLVNGGLLGFVALSIGTVVVKETRPTPLAGPAPFAETAGEPGRAETDERSRIVVTYFHGDVRCTTCRAIEEQAREAIHAGFVGEMQDGELEWRTINFDEPQNAHFVKDFGLAFQSVVLIEESGGRVVRWQNLADVWTKIHGDPQEYERYIQDSTAAFEAGGGGS